MGTKTKRNKYEQSYDKNLVREDSKSEPKQDKPEHSVLLLT